MNFFAWRHKLFSTNDLNIVIRVPVLPLFTDSRLEIVDVFLCGYTVEKAIESMVSGQNSTDSPHPGGHSQMQWDRSNTIGMATETCKYCEGHGTRVVYKTKASPCNCVFRAIFRACLARFRDCAAIGTAFGTVSWEFCSGAGGRRVYSRKQEEYMADMYSDINRINKLHGNTIFGGQWRATRC